MVVNNTASNSQAWQTTDAGQSWTDVTGDLGSQLTKVASVALVHPTATTTVLVAGGLGAGTGGVFATAGPIGSSTHWGLLGSGLPDADVQQVVYNAADDVLVAAPFGRGAWTLVNPFAATTTTAGDATARFRASAQTVTLTATVASAAGPVNEGTVTFTVRSGGTIIGAPVTSATVSGGLARVSYALPAGTPAGTYTIGAVYDPGADFIGSSDGTHTLTVRPAPTAAVGVFDPNTATWYLRNENSAGAPDAGQFRYGGLGWLPVAGDWTGAGHAGVGVFDPSTATWYLRNEPGAGAPDAGVFAYGGTGWLPVASVVAPAGTGASPLAAEQFNSAVAALLGGQKHDRP